MNEYMRAQKKKIEIEKLCEGVRRKSDPGNEFAVWWILQYGAWFRNAWDNSLCCKCCKNKLCGFELKTDCEQYNKTGDN